MSTEAPAVGGGSATTVIVVSLLVGALAVGAYALFHHSTTPVPAGGAASKPPPNAVDPNAPLEAAAITGAAKIVGDIVNNLWGSDGSGGDGG